MKPSLPRFIYFSEGDGQFILCTDYPFVVGQVWKFTDANQYEAKFDELSRVVITDNVEGYYVFIADVGNLVGKESTSLLTIPKMKDHYLSRINERPKRWERYLIK